MTQPRYLVKLSDARIVQAERVRSIYLSKTKVTGKLGSFNTVKHAGWDRSKIRIVVSSKGSHSEAGGTTRPRLSAPVANSAAGVESVLREMQPIDADRLDALDDEIEALKSQLEKARQARADLVKRAWSRSKRVPHSQITPEESRI